MQPYGPRNPFQSIYLAFGIRVFGLVTPPDLNHIENLWYIMQAELDKRKPTTNLTQLGNYLESTYLQWDLPDRINSCIKLNGEYICK